MKIAVISDIHSNILALDNVLNDIVSRKLDTIVCTGDMVGYLPFPREVIERIRVKNIIAIKGNHDDAVAKLGPIDEGVFASMEARDIRSSASKAYSAYSLSEDMHTYLRSLPEALVLKFNDRSVRFVHGSPNSIVEYMYEDETVLKSLLESFDEDIIVSGHTHMPYHKVIEGKHFINAGSVGKPKHGNANALYTILTIDDHQVEVEFAQVAYDVDAMAKAIKENPYISDELIDVLKKG